MDAELKKLLENAGVAEAHPGIPLDHGKMWNPRNDAIELLADYAIQVAKEHYGDGKTRKPFHKFAIDEDMMTVILGGLKRDLQDAIQHKLQKDQGQE